MHQSTLFDDTTLTPEAKAEFEARQMSRHSDPETSKEAAIRHVGQSALNRERCVDAVYALYRKEDGGPTAAEVADWCKDFDAFEANRRLPDAEKQGQVKKGAARKCRVKGTKCCSWEPC